MFDRYRASCQNLSEEPLPSPDTLVVRTKSLMRNMSLRQSNTPGRAFSVSQSRVGTLEAAKAAVRAVDSDQAAGAGPSTEVAPRRRLEETLSISLTERDGHGRHQSGDSNV